MDSEAQKENQMLHTYIQALEKENQSRNEEKDLLLQQIQALNNQVLSLEGETRSNDNYQLLRELEELKTAMKHLEM